MSENLIAYCSWCGNSSLHELIEQNIFSSNVYRCEKCRNKTVKCMIPGCSNMAMYTPEIKDKKDGALTDCYKELANYFKSRELFCGEHNGGIADFSKLNKTLSDLADYKEIFEHKCWNWSSGTNIAAFVLGGGLLAAPLAFLAAPGLAAWMGSIGILGTAGTGTLISTLHGAALTSAALAAIGPAGMLGGTICLTAAGAALGGVTGGMVSNSYYGNIKSFSIKKLQDGHGPAVIFINGFLNGNEYDFTEWEEGVLRKFPDNPLYGVTWESKTLKDLGSMTADGILALVIAVAKQALKKGANPMKILGFVPVLGDILANPWHVAVSKAEQVGILLADLIARTKREDGFILMGHSLGARVLCYILNTLSTKKKQYIKDVYLFGGAIGNAKDIWENAQKAVEGTVYNFYSENDGILSYLYRPAQVLAMQESPFTSEPIGLGRLNLGDMSQNFDVTKQINGHMKYKPNLRKLLSDEVMNNPARL